MQGKYRATEPRRKRLAVPRPARRKEGISEIDRSYGSPFLKKFLEERQQGQ
jgi:hypothetical protein